VVFSRFINFVQSENETEKTLASLKAENTQLETETQARNTAAVAEATTLVRERREKRDTAQLSFTEVSGELASLQCAAEQASRAKEELVPVEQKLALDIKNCKAALENTTIDSIASALEDFVKKSTELRDAKASEITAAQGRLTLANAQVTKQSLVVKQANEALEQAEVALKAAEENLAQLSESIL